MDSGPMLLPCFKFFVWACLHLLLNEISRTDSGSGSSFAVSEFVNVLHYQFSSLYSDTVERSPIGEDIVQAGIMFSFWISVH